MNANLWFCVCHARTSREMLLKTERIEHGGRQYQIILPFDEGDRHGEHMDAPVLGFIGDEVLFLHM